MDPYIGVLLDGVDLSEFLQLLHPQGQLFQLPGDPFRLLLQVVLKLGLAVLHDLGVLLEHRPDLCRPSESLGVELDVVLREDMDPDQVEQVLLRPFDLVLGTVRNVLLV